MASKTNPAAQTNSCLKWQASDQTPSKYSNVLLGMQRCDRSLSDVLLEVGQGEKTSLTIQHWCQPFPTQQSIVALQGGSGKKMHQLLLIQETHLFLGKTHVRSEWELCREVFPLSSQAIPPHCVQQVEHIGKSQMPKLSFYYQVYLHEAYLLSIGLVV